MFNHSLLENDISLLHLFFSNCQTLCQLKHEKNVFFSVLCAMLYFYIPICLLPQLLLCKIIQLAAAGSQWVLWWPQEWMSSV